jgi:hypothetical protein
MLRRGGEGNETFRFPPSQKAASFTIDQALAKMSETAGARHWELKEINRLLGQNACYD